LEAIREHAAVLEGDNASLLQRLSDRDVTIDSLREEMMMSNDKQLQQLHVRVSELEGAEAKLRDDSDTLQAQLSARTARVDELAAQLRSAEERLADFDEILAGKSEQHKELMSRHSEMHARVTAAEAAAEQAGQELLHERATVGALESTLAATTARLEAMTKQANELERQVKEQAARLAGLAEERDTLTRRVEDLEGRCRVESDDSEQRLKDAVDAAVEPLLDEKAALSAQLESLAHNFEVTCGALEEVRAQVAADAAAHKKALSGLQKELEDERVQHGIEVRKSRQLVKELQSQLQKQISVSPRRESNASATSASAPTTPLPKHSHAQSMTSLNFSRVERDGQGLPSVPIRRSPRGERPNDIEREGEDELRHMGSAARAFVQSLKLRLQHAERQVKMLELEVHRKTAIIQYHVVRHMKTGAATSQDMDSNKTQRAQQDGIMAALYRSANDGMSNAVQAEIALKVQAVLEDALVRNIQLQKDMDTLADDLLRTENERDELEKRVEQLKGSLKQLNMARLATGQTPP